MGLRALWDGLKKSFGLAPKPETPPPPVTPPIPPATPRPPAVPLKKAFILVVDDDEGVRSLIGDFLENGGFNVCVASDGWQSVVQSEGFNVQLVITDIMMPGPQGSGIQAYERLRASPHVRKDLPIIFITGIDPEKIPSSFPKDDPRVRLLFKPVDLKELQASISMLICR